MRITLKQIQKIIKATPDNNELRQLLEQAFSYKENIDVFAQFFFDDVCTHESPKFHKEVYKFLFAPGNGCMAAPRGHAKSTVTGLIYLVWCICYRKEQYIVYISQNYKKTVQFLGPVKNAFKKNKWLRFVYNVQQTKNQRDETGRDREDCFDVLDSTIEAVSFEQDIRGFKHPVTNMRPTLIIGDDIETGDRVINPELRDKDSKTLNNEVIPSLDIDGRFKMIGTILHHDSLLVQKLKLYKGKTYRACDPDFKNILWPKRFTKKKLMQLKHDIGSVSFQQEYLNNPVDNASALIKREWIEKCFRPDLSVEDIKNNPFDMITMGVDFAFSDRITADNSAFVSLGAKGDYYYLLECETKHGMSVNEQMKYIKHELAPKFSYDWIGLEENSIKAISKDLEQWKLPLKLFWTAATDPPKNKTSYNDYDFNEKRHTVGKINLIMRLGTAFENGQIMIPYKTDAEKTRADQLLAECTSYALNDGKLVEAGVHPDIPIGLGYALEIITRNQVHFDFGVDEDE